MLRPGSRVDCAVQPGAIARCVLPGCTGINNQKVSLEITGAFSDICWSVTEQWVSVTAGIT